MKFPTREKHIKVCTWSESIVYAVKGFSFFVSFFFQLCFVSQPMGCAAFYLRRLTPPRTPFKTKNFFVLKGESGLVLWGIDRARNALSDALENDFLVDLRSPLVPLQGREGSSVSQHDLFFFKMTTKEI